MQSAMFQLAFLAAYIAVVILYLLTLNNTLKIIKPHNRRVKPALVWLMLIPGFNFVWQFILSKKMSESIEAEVRSLGHDMNAQPLHSLGILCAVFYILTILSQAMKEGQLFVLIPGFIIWISYWAKISQYRKAIRALHQDIA